MTLRSRMAWVCAAVGGLTLGWFAHAEEPQGGPPEPARVARLIKDLGADDFRLRERAGSELAGHGGAVRAQLEAAATSDDPEIRAHALSLLKRLRLADIWIPSVVRGPFDKVMASTVLAKAAEQTGNRLLVGEPYGAFHDAEISIKSDSLPFWSLVDEVCRQSENQVRHHFDTRVPGLVFASGNPGRFPTAYAGPVRARVMSARRVFIEEMDYEGGSSSISHNFQFGLQLMWEDRFRLVAYRADPELLSAVTDTGVQLPSAQPGTSSLNCANPSTRQLSMVLKIQPPPTTATRLAELRIGWGVVAVGDMQVIRVEDLSSTAPHFGEGIELCVESLQERMGGRYELTLVVSRDLVTPQPAEILFQENEVVLFDAQGRSLRCQGQSNALTDQGARIRYTFVAENGSTEPKRLQFTYPKFRADKMLEIVFHDVPLPSSRPQ